MTGSLASDSPRAATAAEVADVADVLARFDFNAARSALFRWFDANGRSFPWRADPTPYRVWISEIMLQQTTTQTVVGYFERFLTRFPDVAALASADEATVLKYWEGLGYYRRARNLRDAAIRIVETFGGVFPATPEAVASLPGVGKYATGAILSFGFDRRFPILEANTTRLHSRLLGLRLETTRAAAQRLLWDAAERWLVPESARTPNVYRRTNAALTDLGRTVCAPSNPRCDACPLEPFCESARRSLQTVVPVLKKKTKTIFRTDVAFWISRGDLFGANGAASTGDASDVLLLRRPENALWAGLWDFPRFETSADPNDSAFDFSRDSALCDRLQLFLEAEVGAPPFDYRPGEISTTISHSVTKYRITLRFARLASARPEFAAGREKTLFDALEPEKTPPNPPPNPTLKPTANPPRETRALPEKYRLAAEVRWVPIAELDAIPLTSPARRLARFLAKRVRQPSARTTF